MLWHSKAQLAESLWQLLSKLELALCLPLPLLLGLPLALGLASTQLGSRNLTGCQT